MKKNLQQGSGAGMTILIIVIILIIAGVLFYSKRDSGDVVPTTPDEEVMEEGAMTEDEATGANVEVEAGAEAMIGSSEGTDPVAQ